MRKFFISIAIFAAAIVAIDFCFGIGMDYLNSHAKGGGVAKRNYISRKSTEEIMLFGSSRMCHHYVPQIIEDSLGMTCYNCGEDGNGIILSYGFLKMILERYTPKMIIYDFEAFDLYQDDNMKYISLLKPYCHEDGIMDIITTVSSKDKWKLKSNLYRYNSIGIRIIGSFLTRNSDANKGYIPLNNTMDYEPKLKVYSEQAVDSVKLGMLKLFIEACQQKGIELVFTLSPRYKGRTYGVKYPEIREICEEYGIPFYDFYGDETISETKDLFQDQTHLNYRGAELYTKELVQVLSRRCQN